VEEDLHEEAKHQPNQVVSLLGVGHDDGQFCAREALFKHRCVVHYRVNPSVHRRDCGQIREVRPNSIVAQLIHLVVDLRLLVSLLQCKRLR